jgi:hypothetical protein
MVDTSSLATRGNAFKLFHSVVVLGAALGSACGQAASLESGAQGGQGGQGGSTTGTGGQASAGAGPTLTLGGSPPVITPGPRSCDYAGGERGTAEAPLGPADCPVPEQFSCKPGASGLTQCLCDPTAPIVPTDCASATQFNCFPFDPAKRACCQCDASAPADESSCPHGWSCQSYDPPVGCQCNVVIL